MARVLVTGATGLLGAALVPELAARGHAVVCHARTSSAELQFDLADRVATQSAIARAEPEVVVNLAALTDVDRCETDPALAYTQNVRTVENLCGTLSSRPATFLIQLSTDQVYDGPGPHTEDDVRLTNYYAFSKFAGELVAQRVPATVLRTNFFGRSRTAGRTSLSDWIEAGLSSGRAITVFTDVLFTPLVIESLATYIALCVERRIPGVFNLGSREGLSKADFAFSLANVLGLPVASMKRGSSSQAGLRTYRPNDMRMDSSRFEQTFGVTLPRLSDEIRTLRRQHHA